MKNLFQPANDAEAAIVKKILAQHGIKAHLISYHDTAYDGLFQSQKGWGIVRVPANDYQEAKRIIEEWKASAPGDLPWNDETTDPE